jgi:hydroxyacid-oxoacid transhydrogenase
MDFANQKARKVGVFTDKTISKLLPMKMAIESLEENGVAYEIYDKTRVEPNEQSCVARFPFFSVLERGGVLTTLATTHSWRDAIAFSKQHDFSHFLAVGGGSVIGPFLLVFLLSSFRFNQPSSSQLLPLLSCTADTAKVANLFTVYKDADMYDFINAPIGKGLPIEKTLRPLIAVPTTAGTGSEVRRAFELFPFRSSSGECCSLGPFGIDAVVAFLPFSPLYCDLQTTGTAIADLPHLSAKTGIANRALRPLLGIVDPLNTDSCPREVHISSGLDVLFHALESWTAIPYTERCVFLPFVPWVEPDLVVFPSQATSSEEPPPPSGLPSMPTLLSLLSPQSS